MFQSDMFISKELIRESVCILRICMLFELTSQEQFQVSISFVSIRLVRRTSVKRLIAPIGVLYCGMN